MRRAAPLSWPIVACLVFGCSTMRPVAEQHPGVIDSNPNAINRTYPGSSTFVAKTVADVMSADSILDQVSMTVDTSSKEYRNFSRTDRQALGISLITPGNDVNFNIKAKSKDGHPVTVAVRLKGESSAEVSLLYGFAGDPELSRDLLDKVELALKSPAADRAVSKTAGSSSSPRLR